MDETADLPAQLDALRDSGAAERAPIRFAYLAALARRAAAQPEAIRQALNARTSIAARELAARPPGVPPEIAKESTASPLAELLAYISQHAHEPAAETQAATGTFIPQGELSPRLSRLRGTVSRSFPRNSKTALAGLSAGIKGFPG